MLQRETKNDGFQHFFLKSILQVSVGKPQDAIWKLLLCKLSTVDILEINHVCCFSHHIV